MVLSLVERGWQATRACSFDAQEQGLRVVHVVKGRIGDVRHVIAPVPGIRMIDLPRHLFWPGVWLCCALGLLSGRLQALLVDNERSSRRLHWWARRGRIPLTLIRQGPDGYELWDGSERVPLNAWCHRALSKR